jgi:hypothetical protein
LSDRRSRSSAARLALSDVGEEILTLADRAGLDPRSSEELRKSMAVWSKRYRARLNWTMGNDAAEDAALVALTVRYLRDVRNEN